MNQKKRIVVNYDNLEPEVKMAILKKYPNGYTNHVFKVTLPNNNFFHAITVDTDDASYLVKVKVKLDKADKLDEDLFSNDLEKGGADDSDTDSDSSDDTDDAGKAD
jgi:hypothetical protein